MGDLFSDQDDRTVDLISQPLAARMRPATLEEYAGQSHLFEQGKPLFEAISQGKLHSMLFWGPPGTGKTTLANLAAKQFGYDMISLNASDVRNKSRIQEILNPVLGNASILGRPMIFVDEVDDCISQGISYF